MAEDKEITCDDVKVLNEVQMKNGEKIRLQIVKWTKRPATIEKRKFWYDEDDGNKEKPGKSKGLNLEDFHTLIANAQEIEKLMTPDK